MQSQLQIEALVADNGGTFSKAKVVDSDTTHLISNEADLKKSSAKGGARSVVAL